MTIAVTVTNGIGATVGTLFAFDRVATVTLSGLASAYNSAGVTGYLTMPDGRRRMATAATGTQTAGALSLAFNLDTSAVAGMFEGVNQTNQRLRLRVIVTATDEVVCDALLPIVPGVNL
ncbi:MAG: hypothetical protein KKI08_12420 [Armatimonadetes bacterium]|nr:hypothetical protein [Armatimonadota bacterium]